MVWGMGRRACIEALRVTFAMLCTDEWVKGQTELNATVVERRTTVQRGVCGE